MAGIVKREFHVFAAESFVDEINSEGNQENNIHMGISRTTAWTGEPNPDVPVDSDDERDAFWNEIQALSRVSPEDAALVVPRKTWVSNANNLSVFDSSLVSNSAYAQNFYVINSELNVYEITTVPVDTIANPASVEPIGAADVSDQGDGYAYRYLYNISPIDANKFLTDNWMPVEFEVNYQAGDPKDNHLLLGAKYAMVYSKISEAGIIPTNFTYRQIGLIRNPLLNDNTDNELKTVASASEYIVFTDLQDGTEPTSVCRDLGELMYLENKKPITRDPNQSEEFRLVLEF